MKAKIFFFILLFPAFVWAGTSSIVEPPTVVGSIPSQSIVVNGQVFINPVVAIHCAPSQDSVIGNPQWSATGLFSGNVINTTNGRITGTAPATQQTTVITVSCTNSTGQVAQVAFSLTANVGTVATGRFIDATNGNDGWTGTAGAFVSGTTGPWKTLGKANAAMPSTPAGTDLWGLSGTTAVRQVLNMYWPGVATGAGPTTVITDPAIFGTYRMSGGTPYVVTEDHDNFNINPEDPEWHYTYPRFKITGTTDLSCRIAQTNHCPYTYGGSNANAVPTSSYAGLVNIQGKYTQVQDIETYGSAGTGFVIGPNSANQGSGYPPNYGVCQGEAKCSIFATVQRVKSSYSYEAGVFLAWGSYAVIRQYEVTLTSLAWGDGLCANTADGGCAAWRVTNVGSPVGCLQGSDCLIENGYIHDDYGDGWALYANRILARGNRGVSILRAMYFNEGGWPDGVTEQNIGGAGFVTDARYPGQTKGNSFITSGTDVECTRCIVWMLDSNTAQFDSTPSKMMIRANLFEVKGTGFNNYVGSEFVGQHATYPGTVDTKWIGNTMVNNGTQPNIQLNWGASPYGGMEFITGFEIANNLFIGSSAGGQLTSTPLSQFHHNQWPSAPTDADLRSPGTGDVYSTNSGVGAFNFAATDTAHFPRYSDFITTGGAGANAASAATYNATGWIRNDGRWNWVLAQRKWVPSCSTSQQQVPVNVWFQNSATDYCGNARNGKVGGIN